MPVNQKLIVNVKWTNSTSQIIMKQYLE